MTEVKRLCLGDYQANCYIVSVGPQAAVIDPGEFTPELESAVAGLKVRYILLTHGHFDHIGGVPELKALTGAPIAVGAGDADMLGDPDKNMSGDLQPESFSCLEPDILLHDGDVLDLGGSRIEVIATPGHTPGGVTFIIDDCMFTGDTLFNLTFGRTDFPGGDENVLFRSIEKLTKLPGDYAVLPGHNRATTLSFERRNNRACRHFGGLS